MSNSTAAVLTLAFVSPAIAILAAFIGRGVREFLRTPCRSSTPRETD
jgi:hypothetical protein